MNRLLLATAIFILSTVSLFAQARTSGTGQSRELIGAVANSAANGNRAIADSSVPTNAASRTESSLDRFSTGQIIMSNVSLGNGHARFEWSLASDSSATRTRPRTTSGAPGIATAPLPLTQIYRVGVGDVLDIQIVELPSAKSTLYTVFAGGVLEYPLAGDPIVVAGLTESEIAVKLQSRIKVLEHPRVTVRVRDYASHSVNVTGLVANPGTRPLRRENVPLFVLLSEAQRLPEARWVMISRVGQPPLLVDLNDQQAASVLLKSGDAVKVLGATSESFGFIYSGGALNSPGQKAFSPGMTLQQAILTSGGLTRNASTKAKLARQGSDGRLVTLEYNLTQIEAGKLADPILQPGDRIVVPEVQ